MDIKELKKAAEKRVEREYDAWSELSGAERLAIVYRTMLQILEEEDRLNFESRLMVARAVWENRIWSATDETFPSYLCELGGRYRNEDGEPSGVAYDMANYVSVVWDVLEQLNENPIEVAASAWSKARLTVSTIKQNTKLLDSGGEETSRIDNAKSVVIVDKEPIMAVLRLAKDSDVTVRDMAKKTYAPRVQSFTGTMSLRKDGLWDVSLDGLSEQQMGMLQRMLTGYAEIRIV